MGRRFPLTKELQVNIGVYRQTIWWGYGVDPPT
jgi:hypothetical protein